MRWDQAVDHGAVSDIGLRRQMNQDSYVVQVCSDAETWSRHGHLFVVADGMGGHAVGELASKIAVDSVPLLFFKGPSDDLRETLRQAIESANAAIHERASANRDFESMGTTCSTLVLSPQGALVGHVGDSRVYRIRGDRIDQLTFDHSLQWEVMRQKRIKLEEAERLEPRHVITRCLGPEESVQVDVEGPYPVLPGDAYVLCSDGLTGYVEDSEIGTIARALAPAEAARLLVHLANVRGGGDNVTVLVVRVGAKRGRADESDLEDDDASPSAHGPSRGELIAYWACALTFVLGVSVALFGNVPSGAFTCGAALVVFVALMFRSRQARRARQAKGSETKLWKPYRSAPAKFSRKVIEHVATVDLELRKTVAAEGWEFDSDRVERAGERADAALSARDFVGAMREHAEAIDLLMTAVYEHRRQRSAGAVP